MWRESLDVLGFFRQQAVRNEKREVCVDMAGGFDSLVQILLNQLPDREPVRPDGHAALDLRVIRELRPAHDIQIPTRKVHRARRDLGDEGLRLVSLVFRHLY